MNNDDKRIDVSASVTRIALMVDDRALSMRTDANMKYWELHGYIAKASYKNTKEQAIDMARLGRLAQIIADLDAMRLKAQEAIFTH